MKRVLCFFGWHRFICSIQDLMDEFGHIPHDGRMPKNAKCSRCGISFKKPKQ